MHAHARVSGREAHAACVALRPSSAVSAPRKHDHVVSRALSTDVVRMPPRPLAVRSYIRGNARTLPVDALRRARAKLARLLARLRAHTALVIELIQQWRSSLGVSSYEPTEWRGHESAREVPRERGGALGERSKMLRERGGASGERSEAQVVRPNEAGQSRETFLWMGRDYLRKIATDLVHLPIPAYSDPLLLVRCLLASAAPSELPGLLACARPN